MGSLTGSGTPITQATNVLAFSHLGKFIEKRNQKTDVDTVISNAGTIRVSPTVSGVAFAPSSTVLLSGIPLSRRELTSNPGASGIVGLDTLRFIDSSGYYTHVVTRTPSALHVSVQRRHGNDQQAMTTVTERKVFFINSDRGKSSGFADWTIYDSEGHAVSATSGTTDTDGSPNATFSGY